MTLSKDIFIHPTAIVEKGVRIGEGTSVWDNVHIRKNAQIGQKGIIGEKTYIAYDVKIGDLVKINAFVYICAGVTIEDMVMVSAGVVFTNDKCPRASDPQAKELLSSSPNEETQKTYVRRGATIGANATIAGGIEIGEFAMIGMGSVVTKNVLPHQLVFGSPAKPKGFVCQCGQILGKKEALQAQEATEFACPRCAKQFVKKGQSLDVI